MDGRVLPNFMYQALMGEPLTVYGDGQQTRSFCYVTDLVDGIYRLLHSDFSEPVNIGNPSEIYGDPEVHPQREDYWGNVNPIGPRGVYDEAKRYAEALTMAYLRQQGVDTAIVRIFNTFGPRMRPNDGRAIPAFLGQALADRPVTVFGEGTQTRSFCYVDDLIRGLVLLAESDEHLPVNLGNPTEMTLLELAERIVALTGNRSKIVFEGLPTDDPKVRRPDIARAREILNWEPTVSLDEGLRRTVASLGPTGRIPVR